MCMPFLIYGIHNLFAVINFVRKKKIKKKTPILTVEWWKGNMKHDEIYQNRWNELGNCFWALCELKAWLATCGNKREISVSVLDAAYILQCEYCFTLLKLLWIFHNPIANSFKTNSNAHLVWIVARIVCASLTWDPR